MIRVLYNNVEKYKKEEGVSRKFWVYLFNKVYFRDERFNVVQENFTLDDNKRLVDYEIDVFRYGDLHMLMLGEAKVSSTGPSPAQENKEILAKHYEVAIKKDRSLEHFFGMCTLGTKARLFIYTRTGGLKAYLRDGPLGFGEYYIDADSPKASRLHQGLLAIAGRPESLQAQPPGPSSYPEPSHTTVPTFSSS